MSETQDQIEIQKVIEPKESKIQDQIEIQEVIEQKEVQKEDVLFRTLDPDNEEDEEEELGPIYVTIEMSKWDEPQNWTASLYRILNPDSEISACLSAGMVGYQDSPNELMEKIIEHCNELWPKAKVMLNNLENGDREAYPSEVENKLQDMFYARNQKLDLK